MVRCFELVVVIASFAAFIIWKIISKCFLKPIMALHKLHSNGFCGPPPSFPLGNLRDMKKKDNSLHKEGQHDVISHDVHSTALPYFATWQKSHGKVFVYWMGTEPFVYVADPEYLKEMAGEVAGKNWGKPEVFRRDREALFGRYGLSVIQGHDWVRHRHVITPAFSSSSLKFMTNTMVECTNRMINRWIDMPHQFEVDIEREISSLAGQIIARTNFGIGHDGCEALYNKLKAMQVALFRHTRYVGVPFGHLISLTQILEARRLGKEVDQLLLSIINARKKVIGVEPQRDLLGFLLQEADTNQNKNVKSLTTRELIDECKTFFFGGHETVALAMSWTLMLLALNPKWQQELRDEFKHVVGDKEIDFTMLTSLKKMSWVMNEVLRLYPSSPNAQRQATSDIRVGDTTIPKGTNIWIDIVSMHHDRTLWGDDVHEFKPERFQDDPLYGGCKHKMGYLPYGFGGRMCIGKNYAILEYKIVLSIILSRFSFSVSPAYRHRPTYFFSFRPGNGIPLIVQRLASS